MTKSPHHSFDVELASEYGIEEAILIHHFQHWIGVNKRLKRNEHEGRTWTYQTFEEIAAHFSYWSADKVRDILARLTTGRSRRAKNKDEKDFDPVLMTGNFNKSKFDRTTWYAFKDQEKFTKWANAQMDSGECPNQNGEMPTPIPDTKTDTETEELFVADAPVGSPPYKKMVGKDKSEEVNQDDMFARAMKESKNWNMEEMKYAWKALSEYQGIVHDWWKFIEGTINKYRNSLKSKRAAGEINSRSSEHKSIKRGNGKCKTTIQQTSHNINQESSDQDMKEQRLPKWGWVNILDMLKESPVG